MTDHQKTTQTIRMFLAGSDQTRNPEIEQAAGEFAAFCRETNDRLRRCIDLLRRGHRSEAIHLADAHPNLMEMCAALDLPELGQWEMLCMGYNWAKPARIQLQAAQELNEAYALDRTMGPLLARHRRLALEEAPIRDRLLVLRQLLSADPGNAGWEQDVVSYEKARAAEFKNDAAAAIRQKDLPQIEGMITEITGHSWSSRAADDVIGALRAAAASLRHDQAVASLRGLLPELVAAYNAMSVSQCKAVMSRWSAVVVKQQIAVPPDLREEIRPINQWIEEQEHREVQRGEMLQVLDALRRAIDFEQDEAEVRRLYRAVRAYGFGVTDDVERDYQARIEQFASAARMRKMMYIIGLGVTVVILVVGVWLVTRNLSS